MLPIASLGVAALALAGDLLKARWAGHRAQERIQFDRDVYFRRAADEAARRWLEQLDCAVDWLHDRASNGTTDPQAHWPMVAVLQRDALLFGDLKMRSSLQRIAEVLAHFCGAPSTQETRGVLHTMQRQLARQRDAKSLVPS